MATILVIDDEVDFRNTTASALRRAGYSVLEAGNTEDGLRMATTDVPDLIISDICMTGGDGLSLLKQIRSNSETATVPFIFMSGHATHETMSAGAELAADGILPKPFRLQTLLTTVSRRLNLEVINRKRTEEIKFQLIKILEAAPDLIGMVDPATGRFQFLNITGRQMLGYDGHYDVSGISLEAIHGPQGMETLKSTIIPTALKHGVWAGEMTLRRADGETFTVREHIQAHREQNGNCTYLSIIAHDLSQSKKLEEERKAMELQLTQAHKLESIGQLAAGIAHEINTPTQYIGDNTRFLQQGFSSLGVLLPKYRDFVNAAKENAVTPALVEEMEKAAADADLEFLIGEIPLAIQQSLEGLDRVTKIVRAMKDFSHPGVNEKTPIDLNHAIETTITVARNEWKYVANLELQLDKTLPSVPCLPGEINQLVLNLVVNAAHAIEEMVADKPDTKGTITVATRRNRNGVEILVQDTGAGIPEHVRQKIFEPFFTTKEVGKGTGQGLAIARSVMAKHGGTIEFETEVGRGTTFCIWLPIEER